MQFAYLLVFILLVKIEKFGVSKDLIPTCIQQGCIKLIKSDSMLH